MRKSVIISAMMIVSPLRVCGMKMVKRLERRHRPPPPRNLSRLLSRQPSRSDSLTPFMTADEIDRGQGCLFGQFIGDALGTRYEFKEEEKVKTQIARDRDGAGFLPILGGGPFKLEPGQVTDDTELAMALAHSIIENHGYKNEAAACNYRSWLESGPFDVGTATRNAFTVPPEIRESSAVCQAIQDNALEHNSESLSNGCLMRISSLAISSYNEDKAVLIQNAKEDAKLTNPNHHTQVATAAYVMALATLIQGGPPLLAYKEAEKVARENSDLVLGLLKAAKKSTEDVKVLLPNGQPAQYDRSHMGYFGVAFQWAFEQMLHARSFRAGLIEVVSRGGDTDTNGCIVGAMLGARFGLEEIPLRWQKSVTDCKQKRVETYPWIDSADLKEFTIKLMLKK